jgi:hypothetical protein
MRWISLGTEGDLTPDEARAEAERIRGLKRQGLDRARQRDRRKSAPLLAEVAEEIFEGARSLQAEAEHRQTISQSLRSVHSFAL